MPRTDPEKAAFYGEPSYIWRAGQDRRLEMILQAAGDLKQGRLLDNGCGIGLYLHKLHDQNFVVFGVELDRSRAREAGSLTHTVACASGEHLPFPSETYDLILSHEVLEHVQDDRAAVEEMVRLLKPPNPSSKQQGGRLILFVPNRGYPFETHGIYLWGRYIFGNIPLINYLPTFLRSRLAPHVRAYTQADLERLFQGLPVRILQREIIFGGYDNLIARWPELGKHLRGFLQSLEQTPFKVLGLSHFWVIERNSG